jgi:MOSC domain-containing protein YiiM
MGRLVSVNIGLPRDVSWRGETVHTAVWKQPVQGRRMVGRLNVDGDGQGISPDTEESTLNAYQNHTPAV